MSEQEDREAFEAWAESRHLMLAKDSTGAYWHANTFAAWMAWQAALDYVKESVSKGFIEVLCHDINPALKKRQ